MNDPLTNYRIAKLREGFAEQALAAAVTGRVDLPVADRARQWDGDAAMRRVFDWAGPIIDRRGQGFLYRDPDADPTTQAAWKLGFADVIDGRLTIVPRGVAAVASVLAGGRGGVDIPAEEQERIRARVCSLYTVIRREIEDWPECPFEGMGEG